LLRNPTAVPVVVYSRPPRLSGACVAELRPAPSATLFRCDTYSIWKVKTELDNFGEQGKYGIDIFFDDVVPVSRAKTHRSLKSELQKRMDPLKFWPYHAIAQLRMSASEIQIYKELLFSVSAPIVA
jgi:hypothetical protein